ncbi:MAG: SsrA-binding protein SmpB [Clostridia bacterium]|nr:SsrA-binding protein SmpB [Clostridia bacterium]
MKVICENKGVSFEYFVEDTIEAGISLDGGEVKSIRRGNVSLKDSYCSFYRGSVFIKNMHIAVYEMAGAYNVKDSKRERRLLLHKGEINRLKEKVSEKGFTVVPIRLYFSGSLVKVLLGVCKGKHTYDKKQSIKEKDVDRAAMREMSNYR